MQPPPLEVVYADDHIIAINKPPGLLVHRSAIDRHETRFALQMLRDQVGQRVYPVHRLDKPTSGILLFALSPDCARQLSGQFESREVTKLYLAVVRGHCPDEGVIDHPLSEKRDPMTDQKAQTDKPAQSAETRYRRLAKVELPLKVDRYPQSRYSLLQLQPVSGRRHQLRRHLKHISHPIIGDTTYGKSVHNRFFANEFGCRRLLLACTTLHLAHPVSGKRLNLSAGLDTEFTKSLLACNWHQQVPQLDRSR